MLVIYLLGLFDFYDWCGTLRVFDLLVDFVIL